MRDYRRFSGDGCVKVVLSGDSNSPPKTTPRREPPSYNSPPTQEVCPVLACAPGPHLRRSRVRVEAPPGPQPRRPPCHSTTLDRRSTSQNVDSPIPNPELRPFHTKKPVSSRKFTFQ